MKITVIVLTYNHQNYLQQALEGIESQEVEADIQIIIHDDASTDQTQDIIQAFSKRTRHSIKFVKQTENKFSQYLPLSPYIFPYCDGDFITFCEGDDYWTSNLKLTTQVQILQQLPSVNICFHPAQTINDDPNWPTKITSNYGETPMLINLDAVIKGDGGFMPTCSLMFRANVIRDLPLWFYRYGLANDYFLQVLGSISGGALYLPNIMSAYRSEHPTSFTKKIATSDFYRMRFEFNFIMRLIALKEHLPIQCISIINEMISKHFGIFASACQSSNNFDFLAAITNALKHSNYKESDSIQPELTTIGKTSI
jgi:glycosyltransferase involved in cell wall biosynthesis